MSQQEEEIVISGFSGRFPESNSLQELSDKLIKGEDLVTDDGRKWKPGLLGVPHQTGKIKLFSKFDSAYFGIVRKQCEALDPLTRQNLECAYEAVLDAGLNPSDLKGSKTNVYYGSTISESELLLIHERAKDGYSIMGRNRGLNANRISYWLDLKGTSYSYDTTWTNGLHGIQLAVEAIQNGICEAAIVGTGSLIIHPHPSVQFKDLNLLSPDGVTRPFDEDANGYARSESVSVFILQKQKNAKRSYGSIVHVLSRCYGHKSEFLLHPTIDCWRELYDEFYSACRVDPCDIEYLEAYAAGFKKHDSDELNVASEHFCKDRNRQKPLLVGSVKSNLGHAEASAATNSLAKVIITMNSGLIPPNLHYSKPNTATRGLLRGQLKVVTELTDYQGGLIAINAFGIGSNYSHLVLKPNPKQKEYKAPEIPRILLLSGRCKESVIEALDKIEAIEPYDDEYIQIINDIYSQNVTRHLYRSYSIVPKPDNKSLRDVQAYSGEKRPIWFIYPGMGSQYPEMARDLLAVPEFRSCIDELHDILSPLGLNLRDLLVNPDPTLFDNILNSFVTIAAVQIGLTDVLKALKIFPDGIIGHSVGENGAAYADGCFTRKEMILASYYRGKASIETQVIKGMMAAVGKGYNDMKDKVPQSIAIACHNGPDSCTISGPAQDVENFVSQLKIEGVFAKSVNVANTAYHSKYIASMGPKLHYYLSQIISEPKLRSKKWLSTSIPEAKWDQPIAQYCSPEYLTNNLLSSVLFEETATHIPDDAICIEIAPHSLLQAILKRSLPKNVINIPLTNRGAKDQVSFLLQAIGKMYIAGLQPQVCGLYPRLPYPVSRGTPFVAQLAAWEHSEDWGSGVDKHAGHVEPGQEMICDLIHDKCGTFSSYKVNGRLTITTSHILFLVWKLFASLKFKQPLDLKICFENINIYQNVYVSKSNLKIPLKVMIMEGTGLFEVTKNDEVIVSGCIQAGQNGKTNVSQRQQLEEGFELSQDEVYAELIQHGHEYLQTFTNIRKLFIQDDEWTATVDHQTLTQYIETLFQLKLLKEAEDNNETQMISFIRRLEIDASKLKIGDKGVIYFNTVSDIIQNDAVVMSYIKMSPIKIDRFTLHEIPTYENNLAYVELQEDNHNGKHLLGYSGFNAAGKEVIGLGSLDSKDNRLAMDNTLVWPIIKLWDLKSAATVPLTYVTAYYSLYEVAELIEEDVVLITDGLTVLGQAFIRILVNSGNKLFTTVRSTQDKQLLTSNIPKLNDDQILILNEDNVEQFGAEILIRTGGQGLTLAVSTTVGDTFDCLMSISAKHCRFLQLQHDNISFHHHFYTETFVNNETIFGYSAVDIEQLSLQQKQKLKQQLENGIMGGVVCPFDYDLIKLEHLKDALSAPAKKNRSTIIELNKVQTSVPKALLPSRYLILGGEDNTWFYITQWLLKKHVESITVLHNDEHVNHLKSRLAQIAKKSNTQINVKKYSPQFGADDLANNNEVDGVILLPGRHSSTLLNELDTRCGEDLFVISVCDVSSEDINVCKERLNKGSPTIGIVWNPENVSLRQLISTLDSCLKRSNRQIISCVENRSSSSTFGETEAETTIKSIIPSSFQDIVAFGRSLPRHIVVTEVLNRSNGIKHTRTLAPVILLPGLKANVIDQIKERLIYPSLLVQLPRPEFQASIPFYAADVLLELKRKVEGPYIIVGEGWGGLIAVELVRQLEANGQRAHLFLINGTRFETAEKLATLAPQEFDDTLLRTIFDIQNTERLVDGLSWEQKVERCLPALRYNERKDAVSGLNALRERIRSSLTYKLPSLLESAVTIITSHCLPNSAFNKLSNDVDVLLLKEGEEEGTYILNAIHQRSQVLKFNK